MLPTNTDTVPDRRLKIREVARMLGIAIPTIYSRLSRERHKLPRVTQFKDGARGFLLSDVLAWLHSDHQIEQPQIGDEVRRGPGRPRKTTAPEVEEGEIE